ncbi:MAG TPA: hypothetical protein VG734_24690 [Lacunisphaera sp.]|nr:hypothetical protein [Lacunisphaera sp.]
MKKASWAVILLWTLAMAGASAAETEIERLARMEKSLREHGVAGFLVEAEAWRWQAPHIPSQWHTENVSAGEQREVDIAARAFGRALLTQQAAVARRVQLLPVGAGLHELTEQMLALARWCWGTEGYGNSLLAQRSIDLATVGVARLTFDLSFPLDKCAQLAAQLEQPWLATNARVRILNKEAGVALFPPNLDDQETLERIWGTGCLYLLERKNPRIRAKLQLPPGPLAAERQAPALRAHLDFFADLEPAARPKPQTLPAIWDVKAHALIVNGAVNSPWNIGRARALLAYRQRVGYYPGKFEYTAEQIARHHATEAEYAARAQGQKLSPMITDPEALGRLGFEQALRNLPRRPGISEYEWQEGLKLAGAWETYHLIQRGKFLDEDAQRQEARARLEELPR